MEQTMSSECLITTLTRISGKTRFDHVEGKYLPEQLPWCKTVPTVSSQGMVFIHIKIMLKCQTFWSIITVLYALLTSS